MAAAIWLLVRPHDGDPFGSVDAFFDDIVTLGTAFYATVVLGLSALLRQSASSCRNAK